MTLRKLAKKLDVSYPYLSQIENDRARPSEGLSHRIAEIFNQNAEQLTFLARDIESVVLKIVAKYPTLARRHIRKEFLN